MGVRENIRISRDRESTEMRSLSARALSACKVDDAIRLSHLPVLSSINRLEKIVMSQIKAEIPDHPWATPDDDGARPQASGLSRELDPKSPGRCECVE
jgi:hypothetical protein